MGNKISTRLRFCFFFSLLSLLSGSPASLHLWSQQNSGKTVIWLEGWRDEVTERKGMAGRLNGKQHPAFFFYPEFETVEPDEL